MLRSHINVFGLVFPFQQVLQSKKTANGWVVTSLYPLYKYYHVPSIIGLFSHFSKWNRNDVAIFVFRTSLPPQEKETSPLQVRQWPLSDAKKASWGYHRQSELTLCTDRNAEHFKTERVWPECQQNPQWNRTSGIYWGITQRLIEALYLFD